MDRRFVELILIMHHLRVGIRILPESET